MENQVNRQDEKATVDNVRSWIWRQFVGVPVTSEYQADWDWLKSTLEKLARSEVAATPPEAAATDEKDFVREIFPDSYLRARSGGYDIIDTRDPDTAMAIGCGQTPSVAWNDAAIRQGWSLHSAPEVARVATPANAATPFYCQISGQWEESPCHHTTCQSIIPEAAALSDERTERIWFERWYAANKMGLYLHLDQRLRMAIEDTARAAWFQGRSRSAPPSGEQHGPDERSEIVRLRSALNSALELAAANGVPMEVINNGRFPLVVLKPSGEQHGNREADDDEPKLRLPAECLECGEPNGPVIEVGADYPGWICTKCLPEDRPEPTPELKAGNQPKAAEK